MAGRVRQCRRWLAARERTACLSRVRGPRSWQRVGVVGVAGLLVVLSGGCGDDSSQEARGNCSAGWSGSCCEPENLAWVYERVTDPESHSYPRTIFELHRGTETALNEDDASSSPSISPDGGRIVFERGSEGSPESAGYSRSRLYVMDRDGTDEEPLLDPEHEHPDREDGAPNYDASPRWSPDGSHIAFLRNVGFTPPGDRPEDVHEVMVVAADGGEPRPLSGSDPDLHDPGPAWSADSTRLAWVAASTGRLHWASLDGEEQGSLALPGEVFGTPAWTEGDETILVSFFADEDRADVRLHRVDVARREHTELAVPLAHLWALPTGEVAGLERDGHRSTLVVFDVDAPEDRQDIATIEGSRIMPEWSVYNRTRGPVNAVPATPDGWDSCSSP